MSTNRPTGTPSASRHHPDCSSGNGLGDLGRSDEANRIRVEQFEAAAKEAMLTMNDILEDLREYFEPGECDCERCEVMRGIQEALLYCGQLLSNILDQPEGNSYDEARFHAMSMAYLVASLPGGEA